MLAAPARWPCAASGPTALAQRRLPSSITPTCLGIRSAGSRRDHAGFVRRVEHPPEPALPVRHGPMLPYSRRRTSVTRRSSKPGSRYLRSGKFAHGPKRLVTATSAIRHRALGDQVRETLDEVKPKLRGWLHAASAPLTLAAGIVLVVLSPTTRRPGSGPPSSRPRRWCCSRSPRSTTAAPGRPRVWAFLRRFDHANIFLLIAGTYTPFTLLLLARHRPRRAAERRLDRRRPRRAVPGVLGRRPALALHADLHRARLGRGLLLPATSPWRPAARRRIGTAVLVLIVVGGGLYTLGGVVYGFKRPNPFPRWFGFHEVFHTLTIAGLRRALRRRLASRRTPCAEHRRSSLARSAGVGDRAVADHAAADVRRGAAVDQATGRRSSGTSVATGSSATTTTTAPGLADGAVRPEQVVAVRAGRVADDRDLERAVEQRLGRGQRPAGEPGHPLGQRAHVARAPPRRRRGAGRSR